MTTTTTTCTPTHIVPCEEGDFAAELLVTKPKQIEYFQGNAYYRVRFQIRAVCNVPTALFVVRKRPVGFSDTVFQHEFESVAMPVDLGTIPTNDYDFDLRKRVSVVDIRFTHISYADAAVLEFKQRIKALLDALRALNNIGDADSTIIR